MKIKDLESRVKAILIKDTASRASDDWLYYCVISEMGFDMNAVTAKDFLLTYRNRKLPSIESVGRCRRKLQEENESLKPSEKVQKGREVQRERFYNYATKQGEFCF
jgi:hypothetical protein